MIAMFLSGFINVLIKVVQYLTAGLNLILDTYFPDISAQVVSTTTSITNFLVNLTWPLSIVPVGILRTLAFIVGIEIARHTIYISTHVLIRAWNLFQKAKFW